MLIDAKFCRRNKACYTDDDLRELFPQPRTLREVLTLNDGAWLGVRLEHRLWVATRPEVLSQGVKLDLSTLILDRIFKMTEEKDKHLLDVVTVIRARKIPSASIKEKVKNIARMRYDEFTEATTFPLLTYAYRTYYSRLYIVADLTYRILVNAMTTMQRALQDPSQTVASCWLALLDRAHGVAVTFHKPDAGYAAQITDLLTLLPEE